MGRDLRIDTLKGVLIFLVVLGHVLGRSSGEFSDGLEKIIYSFHMPLFVLVSGYFTKVDNRPKFIYGIKNLFIVLVIFQVLSAILKTLSGNFSLSFFVQPIWTLWYLLSLIYWRVILYLFKEIPINKLLMSSFFIGILGGFLPIGYMFSIQRTFTFFPLFVLGYYLKCCSFDLSKLLSKRYLFLTLSITIYIIDKTFVNVPMDILRGALCYDECTLGNVSALYRLFYYVLSLSYSLAIFSFMPQNENIANIGKDSLYYYLLHGFFIEYLLMLVIKITDYSINAFESIIITIIIMGFVYWLKRIPIVNYIVNPLFYLKKGTNTPPK